jgi:hypothetical protein
VWNIVEALRLSEFARQLGVAVWPRAAGNLVLEEDPMKLIVTDTPPNEAPDEAKCGEPIELTRIFAAKSASESPEGFAHNDCVSVDDVERRIHDANGDIVLIEREMLNWAALLLRTVADDDNGPERAELKAFATLYDALRNIREVAE